MYMQCLQSLNFTFALVGFAVEFSSKLNGPGFISRSPRVISVAHWIYLSLLGKHYITMRNLLPYIICPVSVQVVYSYQYDLRRLTL